MKFIRVHIREGQKRPYVTEIAINTAAIRDIQSIPETFAKNSYEGLKATIHLLNCEGTHDVLESYDEIMEMLEGEEG